jgi:cyanate permease
MGAASLLWLPAWWKWKPAPQSDRASYASRIGYLAIFRQRNFWGCAAGHFSFNYLSYFFLTWLPFYLSHERHLSQAELARAAGAYYLVDSAVALLTGCLCDFCIKRGARASFVRKFASVAGHLTAAIAMIACAFAGAGSYYPWLLVAAVGSGMAACGVFLFAQTLAGPRAVGQWSALQNGIGNFAGLTGPALTGFLVDRSGNFFSAFAVAALISLAGGLVWGFGVRFAPVDWGVERESAAATN